MNIQQEALPRFKTTSTDESFFMQNVIFCSLGWAGCGGDRNCTSNRKKWCHRQLAKEIDLYDALRKGYVSELDYKSKIVDQTGYDWAVLQANALADQIEAERKEA